MSAHRVLIFTALLVTNAKSQALPVDGQLAKVTSRGKVDMSFVNQYETADVMEFFEQITDVQAQDDAAVMSDSESPLLIPAKNSDVVTVLVNKDHGKGTRQNLTVTYQDRLIFKTAVSTGGGIHQPKNDKDPDVERNNPPECTETPDMNLSFTITQDRFAPLYDSNFYGVPLRWTFRIYQGIFFHQVPTAASEGLIGRPASGGCVRIPAVNAETFYRTLHGFVGKTVHIIVKGGDSSQKLACLNSRQYKSKLAAWGEKYKRTPEQLASIKERAVRAANRDI
jgi:hypothetical protein